MRITQERIAASWLAKQSNRLERGIMFKDPISDDFVILHVNRVLYDEDIPYWYGKRKRHKNNSFYELVLYACDVNSFCDNLGIKLEDVICK